MNKTIKIILTVLLSIVLTVNLVGCGITGFVSWVWGGVRFTPEEAMEAVGIGASKQERIEAEDCYFYYETIADNYESAGESADWIYTVTPVKKQNGMWSASTNPRSHVVYTNGEGVGTIISYEINGKYHNFIIPFVTGGETATLPNGFPIIYDKVAVNGIEINLFKHSYFVTDIEVKEFEISGTEFTVDN